jgi:hypothetical protein
VHLVPKKGGEWRFTVDYRDLNAITVKDVFPLPFISEILDKLQGYNRFTLMDLKNGFFQCPMAEDSIPMTAFTCHMGLFEYLRQPFGLTNGPASFQRNITKILAPLIAKGKVMVFVDDIVCMSKGYEQHMKDVDQVLTVLREAGVTLKESKCRFAQEHMDLLGYHIQENGVTAQKGKTQAIDQMPRPKTVKQVRQFLGMASYYRMLIPHFAEYAYPLNKLTSKKVKWQWTEECEKGFVKLKQALASESIVAYPQLNKSYTITSDASDKCIGSILSQKCPKTGLDKPVQYISHQLDHTQAKWSTVEKEAFSLIYSLKKWRP